MATTVTFQNSVPNRESIFPKYNPNKCQTIFTNPRKVFCFVIAPIILFCMFGIPIIVKMSQNDSGRHKHLSFNPDWDGRHSLLFFDQSETDTDSIIHDNINSNLVYTGGIIMTQTNLHNRTFSNKQKQIEKEIKQDIPKFIQSIINNITEWTSKTINENVPTNLKMNFQSWMPDKDDNNNGNNDNSPNCNDLLMSHLSHKYNQLFEYLDSILTSQNANEAINNMEYEIPSFELDKMDDETQNAIEKLILQEIDKEHESSVWEWSMFGGFGGGFQIYCNDNKMIDAGGGSGAYYHPKWKSKTNTNGNHNYYQNYQNYQSEYEPNYAKHFETASYNEYENKYKNKYSKKGENYQNIGNEYENEYKNNEYRKYDNDNNNNNNKDSYGGGGGGIQLYLNESLIGNDDKIDGHETKFVRQYRVVSIGGGTGTENDANTIEMDWDSQPNDFYHYLPIVINKLRQCYNTQSSSNVVNDTRLNVKMEGGGGASASIMFYRANNDDDNSDDSHYHDYGNENYHDYCRAQFSFYFHSG